jgi:hypothetical protein
MSGRWWNAALSPDPIKQRVRGQEIGCRPSVSLSDNGDKSNDEIGAKLKAGGVEASSN